MQHVLSPFCGDAPVPSEIALRWALDPALLALLAGGALLGLRLQRRRAFLAGWFLLTLALVSPVCALSVSLFSARIGQHLIIALAAAPLLAHALQIGPRRVLMFGAAFGALMLFWHAPQPYDATFRGPLVYWLMHTSLLASAVLFWSALSAAAASRLIAALTAAALVTVTMTLLGAILSFADRPLYVAHLTTTQAWGLSPLVDQRLGGALLWAAGGTASVVLVLAAISPIFVRRRA